jgi:outer membrane protein assembly factor BamB
MIYIAGWDGRLLAVGPDGKRRWAFRTRLEVCSTPAIADDGTILFGSRDRHLYAVTPEGREKWRFKTGAWVDTSVALGTDGSIYFGSWDGKFYALTAGGEKKWEFATGGPILSSAAIDWAGTIYFGAHDGRLYALNPDGTKRWEFRTGARILSSPAVANNGDLIFTSLDGKLYDVTGEGKLRWSLATGGISSASPVVAEEGTIYLGVNSNHCAVTVDGRWKWRGNQSPTGFAPWDFIRATPLALADGSVVMAGTDLQLLGLGADGIMRWNHSLLLGSYASPGIGPTGTLYAAAPSGKLFALVGTVPPARSSWPMFRADPQRTGRARPKP